MILKNKMNKKILSILLAMALLVSGITLSPAEVRAAGWLDNVTGTIELGTAVSGSIKEGDYFGRTDKNLQAYWHIYKFTMPKNGLLNIYLESRSDAYFTYTNWAAYQDGFTIYSATDPDYATWCSTYNKNQIQKNYSASRAMYYGSTEIALGQGDYYFAVMRAKTNNTPYYLTLSYREPVINVTSISLSPSSLSMEVGDQKTVIPTVLPDNATDKTVVWKSENPSIATVEDGIVTAVSIGTTSVSASSSDGEIKAVCPVAVQCTHNYESSLSPAGIDFSGYISKICTKCGTETKDRIAAISRIELSETSYHYDSKVHKPSVMVLDDDGNALEDGKDYVVSYPDNMKDIGTYTVTIDFKGSYEGTQELDFTILPVPVESVSLNEDKITMEIGTQQKLIATVLPDDATDKSILWKSSDPSVLTVDDNGVIKAISVGTAYVIATTVDGGETATCTVNVVCKHDYHTTLTPATQNRNGVLEEQCIKCGNSKRNTTIYAISDIHLSNASYIYNGKTQAPSVIVRDTTGEILKNNIDYTISYTGNRTNVGIHTITVKFKGNYSGSISKQFTIYPESTTITKIKSKKKGFSVSWKKQAAQTTGYEIAYSANSRFRKNKTKTVTIGKNKTKKSFNKLNKGKRYYVRIRTYKNVKVNGRTTRLYSGWSTTNMITTKK